MGIPQNRKEDAKGLTPMPKTLKELRDVPLLGHPQATRTGFLSLEEGCRTGAKRPEEALPLTCRVKHTAPEEGKVSL